MLAFLRSALAGLAAVLLVASAAVADPFPSTYDAAIKDAWELYHPGDDWRFWKAQLFQESRLDPNARSAAGAEGLAQFMPSTWAEVTTAMKYGAVDRRMAEPAIRAGAFYMRRLMLIWKEPRPPMSRRQLAQASYNAGAGSLIKAQKLCDGARRYQGIVWCLPRVTGERNARETTTYVERIARWHRMML